MQLLCRSIGCLSHIKSTQGDFCAECTDAMEHSSDAVPATTTAPLSLSQQYPKYYKPVGTLAEIDVYAVHHLFQIQDCSGALQHASKKLLLSGVRTGGKSAYKDIKEARDTLTRWLQLNEPNQLTD